MKKTKSLDLTVAIIAWMDASQDPTSEVHFVDDPVNLSFCLSTGIIVKETKSLIAISRDYFPNLDDRKSDRVRHREIISKKDIVWIKKLYF